MISEGFETDFNNWELQSVKECDVIKTLFDVRDDEDSLFLKKIDDLKKTFSSEPAKFVVMLKQLNEKLFTQRIAKCEGVKIKHIDEMILTLRKRHRISQNPLSQLKKIYYLKPDNFTNTTLPTKLQIYEYVSEQNSEKKAAFEKSLFELHSKYQSIINGLIAFTNLISWYYRTYEEKPEIMFLWDYSDDKSLQFREKMKTPFIDEFAGVLRNEHDIYRAPKVVYLRPLMIRSVQVVDRVVEMEIAINKTQEIQHEKVVENKIILQKTHELPVSNTIEKPVEVIKEIEIIKEVEVLKEYEKPVKVIKKYKTPAFYVIAGFVVGFCIIGLITGFLLRMILLPPGDKQLQKMARDAEDAKLKAIGLKNDAEDAKLKAVNLKNAAESALLLTNEIIAELKKQISALELKNTVLQTENDILTESLENMTGERDDLANELTNLKNELNNLITQRDNLSAERNEITIKLTELQKKFDELTLEKDKLQAELEKRANISDKTLAELNEEIKTQTDKINELTEALKLKNTDFDVLKNSTDTRIAELMEKLVEANKTIAELSEKLYELKLKYKEFEEGEKIRREEKILLQSAFSTRSKERALIVEGNINEFIKKNPERKSNFTKAFEHLEKAKQILGKSSRGETAKEFKLLAKLTNGTAYPSPSANDLPGILTEILNREIGLATSADIVLIIDTTSTMGNDIDALKKGVSDITANLSSICRDVRVAVILYRDLPNRLGDTGYITKIQQPFTLFMDEVIANIKKITLNDGSGNFDIPEAVFEGIMTSLKDLNWSHRAEKRLLILMGDAPPATGQKKIKLAKSDKIVDLEVTHEFTIESIKNELEKMQKTMKKKELPVQIFPIIIAED
ncbi:MAG: hypothetical protein K8S87_02805 [Planctomycetes bacterium]|nr:hypothetical protein [Planctomycetota bacterium]